MDVANNEPRKPHRMKLNVLIVDDEPLIGQLVTTILRRMSFLAEDITYHQNLEEALRDIPLFPTLDLLITDWNIPHGDDGAKVITCVRKNFPSVQIIAMSGRADNMESIDSHSPDVFLAKPFEVEKLQMTVHAILQKIMARNAA